MVAYDVTSVPPQVDLRVVPLEAHFSATELPVIDNLSETGFLISLPGDDVLMIPAAGARMLSQRNAEFNLRRTASVVAAEYRRERYRIERRARISDWLMGYVDELYQATTSEDVYRALIASASAVVGAFAAVVYAVDLKIGSTPVVTADLPTLPTEAHTAFPGPRVVIQTEALKQNGTADGMLAPIFRELGATQLMCVPVVQGALLLLIERRRERVFTAEDRDFLQWLLEQARRTLRRLGEGAPEK